MRSLRHNINIDMLQIVQKTYFSPGKVVYMFLLMFGKWPVDILGSSIKVAEQLSLTHTAGGRSFNQNATNLERKNLILSWPQISLFAVHYKFVKCKNCWKSNNSALLLFEVVNEKHVLGWFIRIYKTMDYYRVTWLLS